MTQNTENELGENYISRNVMEKIELHKEKVDAAARADDVANMIFNEKDDVAFLQFLANDYGEMLKDISPKNIVFSSVIKKET